MREEDIIRLVTEQIASDKKEELLSQISDNPENREEYYKFKNLWALTSQSTNNKRPNVSDLQKFKKTIQKKKSIILRKKVIAIFKYAAILAIAFFAGRFVFENSIEVSQEFNEINVPPGQIAQVTLSDGTSIFINSCSKLKYPTSFHKNERSVYLFGEAYFSIAKSSSPFIVETSDKKKIKVLGTKFNLMAYPEDILYQATLIEGKIEIIDSIRGESVELREEEQYSYNVIKNKSKIRHVDTNLYTSWKDGIYLFDHETLEDLSKRFERVFNVKIKIANNSIKQYKFSGTISRNLPFEQILKIIQISAPIKYKIKKENKAIKEVELY